jgi:hypothetical protein
LRIRCRRMPLSPERRQVWSCSWRSPHSLCSFRSRVTVHRRAL